MVDRRIFVTVLCTAILFAPLASAQTRITDATTNGATLRDSYDPKTDGAGTRIVFRSDADLLSETRADNDYEIWLWDDTTGLQRLTDATANGGTARDSYLPIISDSGTRIAFQSDADMLSEGRAGADEEIWLWDDTTGLQRLTDALANGATGRDSYEASVSPNGNRVAFRSDADLLSEGRAASDEEIWLWDETTGLQRLTDALANGATGRDSYEPALSADGSRVVFQSDADLLSEGRAANDEEIWLWDQTTGLQRITDTLANGATGRDCYDAAINADGTRLVFRCDADFLNEGRTDNDYEIWLWDETTGLQRLTDVTANGGTLRDAYDPEINAGGTLISFESDADFLSEGIPDNQTEIWTLDIATANLTRVTIASDTDRDSYDADISADGAAIAIESDSDFLGQLIPASQDEIWLFGGAPTAAITLNKTVGLDPSVCATTDAITVPAGTDVTYCYEVTNTGDITLTVHDLVDSELGTILSGFVYDLAPAASVPITTTTTINASVVNTATWTASVPGGPSTDATDTATVNVEAFPDIAVDPASMASSLLVGTTDTQVLTISNNGLVDLFWDIFEEPALSAPAPPGDQPPVTRIDSQAALDTEQSGLEETEAQDSGPRDPAAAARARQMLFRAGLLLIPDSTNDRVMAFDPSTGDLIDADFIPSNAVLGTAINAILSASGTSFLVSDQTGDVVHEFDLDGNYLGVFAPAGGANTAILDNIRGISLDASGNLLVTVGGGANDDAVAQFDTGGNYLGNFVANGAGGLDSPFDVYGRTADWLVAAITSDAIHRYDLAGAYIADLTPIDSFPEQTTEAGNGNVLVANFSGTQEGVVEFTAAGALVGVYDPASLGGYRGAYELPNGNILTTNGGGVHEIDRSGNLVETKISGVSGRFIESVTLQTGCTALADVPWLSANPISGTTTAGSSTPVDVTFDATVVPVGIYDASLCVFSSDPDEPVIEVPVQMEVVIPVELMNFTIE